MRYIAILFLLFQINWSYAQERVEVLVDDDIVNALMVDEFTPVMVVMKDQADLSGINPSWSKEEKTQEVYNRLQAAAHRSQSDLKQYLDTRNIDYSSYFLVNMIQLYVNETMLSELMKRNDIAQIIADEEVQMLRTEEIRSSSNLRDIEPEWGIVKIQADSVWALGYEGQGVVIGGQDTGYDWDVSPLMEKYRGWSESGVDHNYSWHDAIREINPMHGDTLPDAADNPCGLDLKEPCDDNNHGTHTMGTMVGSDSLNQIGVAPEARWIGCRNMERGYGMPSTYIECFEWFLAPTDLNGENPQPALAPDVINNSWGCPPVEGCNEENFHLVEMAVDALKAAGVVVVVSAGNDGPSCGTIDAPAAMFEGSFTVGATNSKDTIARFSSRGLVSVDSSFRMKPNVSAPGVGVRSVVKNGVFRTFSGTSMAGPHVAGTVALIISANPDLRGRVDIIEDILEQTAVPLSGGAEMCNDIPVDAIPNPTYGYGRIDALAAVKKALAFTTSTDEANEEIRLQVFPNPNNGKFTITSEEEMLAVHIYTIEGKLIHRESPMSRSVDIDLKSGAQVLIYEVISQRGKSQGRVVVSR